MSASLVVPHRFHGPPSSGNGGWCAGALAAHLPGGPVRVRLHAPPPLGVPLAVEVADGTAVASGQDGSSPVLTATRVPDVPACWTRSTSPPPGSPPAATTG